MITIEISPLDTLFFKNAKPFSAGDESWADGMFLPNPSTIYGALRAIYFRNNPHEIDKANSENDPTKDLVIHKIYLKQNKNVYFPLPLDVVYKKGKEIDGSYILQHKKQNTISNSNVDYLQTLSNNETVEKFDNSFLSIRNFKKYQNSNSEKFRGFDEIKNIDKFIINEPKIGIKINKYTQTVKEGYLYRIDFKRLEIIDDKYQKSKAKIAVEFSGLDIEDSKIIRLGGEGKIATIQEIKEVEIDFPKNISKKFKLYLLTPAIFNNGWLPSKINNDTLVWEDEEVKLKLLTASIGKYKLIGGFDMKKNRPKLMYRAVPEGSVYYFEILEGNLDDIKNKFHNQSISDKLKNEGYGITFIGAVE